jgi:hypothetical protein
LLQSDNYFITFDFIKVYGGYESEKTSMGIIFCLCLFVTLLPTAALAAKKPTKVMVGGTNVVTDSTS